MQHCRAALLVEQLLRQGPNAEQGFRYAKTAEIKRFETPKRLVSAMYLELQKDADSKYTAE